jgi:hypothetical protein
MGILIILLVLVLLASPILLMPGWRSLAVAVAANAAIILWVGYSASRPSSSCADPNCGGGAMAGFLVGQVLGVVAWYVLGVVTFIKAVLLASRR